MRCTTHLIIHPVCTIWASPIEVRNRSNRNEQKFVDYREATSSGTTFVRQDAAARRFAGIPR
jgi:hypothetical protein